VRRGREGNQNPTKHVGNKNLTRDLVGAPGDCRTSDALFGANPLRKHSD